MHRDRRKAVYMGRRKRQRTARFSDWHSRSNQSDRKGNPFETHLLRQTEDDIRALYRLSSGSLAQVVYRADGDEGMGGL